MKYTDGLWLEVSRQVAKKYPDIEFEDRIVDNMCMQLVQKPELYDVLVLPNLYGDMLSDLAAGLVGGLGVAPGANIGPEGAVFEATHGSAPKYKGQNKVNPTALILSGMLMLRHLGETDAADRLESAVADVIAEGQRRDLRPEAQSRRSDGRRHSRNGRRHHRAIAEIKNCWPGEHSPSSAACATSPISRRPSALQPEHPSWRAGFVPGPLAASAWGPGTIESRSPQ